jgi:L-alanine-DL-glutamate epimerase-like enolase superfamily enzyme
MIVSGVEFRPCEMPLEDKEWKFALASVSSARGWVVRVSSDEGQVGYGYAPAIPHMGSTFEGLPIELERFKPLVVGRDPHHIEAILKSFDASLSGASQAKGAFDCAIHDLLARAAGRPLSDLLGGKLRDSIPVLRILAIKSPEEMAAQASRLLDQGYSYFKIKVHGDVEEDVACVRAIRTSVGEKAHLTIDANQSYSAKNAIYAIQRMAEYGLDIVEQPVSRYDLKGLESVTRSVPVTVEADEGAGTLEEIMVLVSGRIVDAVSLKLPKLGGLRNAIAAARICEAGGVRYRLGAHVGTRLLNAHAIQLAATLPEMNYACEVGEFARMYDDPFTGIEVSEGKIAVPQSPGCGVVSAANAVWDASAR